jgi:glycerol-3-phosphate dehydrogenase (NAD(P)+)
MADSSRTRVRRAVVIGDGGWGTALSILLERRGVETRLWSNFQGHSEELASTRENRRYLPGVTLPESLRFTADPSSACQGADIAISAVPTQYLRGVAERFEEALGNVPLVSATKCLEIETLRRPSEILREVFGNRPNCVLSGPSHAEEVARLK